MNSNEIVYERKMTGSFMKLRCDEVRPLDEKILLKNPITITSHMADTHRCGFAVQSMR